MKVWMVGRESVSAAGLGIREVTLHAHSRPVWVKRPQLHSTCRYRGRHEHGCARVNVSLAQN